MCSVGTLFCKYLYNYTPVYLMITQCVKYLFPKPQPPPPPKKNPQQKTQQQHNNNNKTTTQQQTTTTK